MKEFLKQALKKLSNLPKKIQLWKKTCVNKFINVVQLLVNQMEKLTAAIKICLLTWLVEIYDIFLFDLKDFQ